MGVCGYLLAVDCFGDLVLSVEQARGLVMDKKEQWAEAARILGIADAMALQLWRYWLGTSWTDFFVGLAAVGGLVFGLWLVLGG